MDLYNRATGHMTDEGRALLKKLHKALEPILHDALKVIRLDVPGVRAVASQAGKDPLSDLRLGFQRVRMFPYAVVDAEELDVDGLDCFKLNGAWTNTGHRLIKVLDDAVAPILQQAKDDGASLLDLAAMVGEMVDLPLSTLMMDIRMTHED